MSVILECGILWCQAGRQTMATFWKIWCIWAGLNLGTRSASRDDMVIWQNRLFYHYMIFWHLLLFALLLPLSDIRSQYDEAIVLIQDASTMEKYRIFLREIPQSIPFFLRRQTHTSISFLPVSPGHTIQFRTSFVQSVPGQLSPHFLMFHSALYGRL